MVLSSLFRTRSARLARTRRRALLDALESRIHLTATAYPLPHADTAYLPITSGHELDGSVSAPGQVSIDVTANDAATPIDGSSGYVALPSSAQAIVVTGPAHGTVTWDSAKHVATYTAGADFTGADRFTYVLNVDGEQSDPTTVDISGAAVWAQNDYYSVLTGSYNTTVIDDPAQGVLSNDHAPGVVVDPDVYGGERTPPAGSTAHLVDASHAHGSVTLNPDGTFTYVANSDMNHLDSAYFTYYAQIGNVKSPTVTVTLETDNNGWSLPDLTMANFDTNNYRGLVYSVLHDTSLTLNDLPTTWATGPATGRLQLNTAPTVAPAHGTLSVDSATGKLVYTPAAGFGGIDSFTIGAQYTNTIFPTSTLETVDVPPVRVTINVEKQATVQSMTVTSKATPFAYQTALADAGSSPVFTFNPDSSGNYVLHVDVALTLNTANAYPLTWVNVTGPNGVNTTSQATASGVDFTLPALTDPNSYTVTAWAGLASGPGAGTPRAAIPVATSENKMVINTTKDKLSISGPAVGQKPVILYVPVQVYNQKTNAPVANVTLEMKAVNDSPAGLDLSDTPVTKDDGTATFKIKIDDTVPKGKKYQIKARGPGVGVFRFEIEVTD